jgi:hypothetical protein
LAERPLTDIHVRDVDVDDWDWVRIWATTLRAKHGPLLSALLRELRTRQDLDVRQIYNRYRAPDDPPSP